MPSSTQPTRLTYLSHISQYRVEDYLDRRLLRRQPETIIICRPESATFRLCFPALLR